MENDLLTAILPFSVNGFRNPRFNLLVDKFEEKKKFREKAFLKVCHSRGVCHTYLHFVPESLER